MGIDMKRLVWTLIIACCALTVAAQEEGVTLTVDQKNGFVLYESRQDEYLTRIELCYWNEADKKHKLIAYNVACFMDGK